jgi:hypothetical protein
LRIALFQGRAPVSDVMGVDPARCDTVVSRRRTETIMDEYLRLKQLVEEVADDVYKAVGGNKAAGTRVRKAMQEIKNTAQEIRKKVLGLRTDDEAPPPPQP